MTRREPCPHCEVEINVLAVFDPERGPETGVYAGEQCCPECGAWRRVIEALVDGDITREECVKRGQFVDITPERRRELQAQRDEMDDPAEENRYTKEFGVGDDRADGVKDLEEVEA